LISRWRGTAERFIFLWIAFKAAYANEIGDRERSPEQQVFECFLQNVLRGDACYPVVDAD
jgi:hypothetical protein